MDVICGTVCGLILIVAVGATVWATGRTFLRWRDRALLKAGTITLAGLVVFLAVLYVGHCTGALGDVPLLHYIFQCACPRSLENIRIRKLYSEHAEIIFSACDDVGPIPSPSGEKVAVIDYENPDESYVWFLPTDERMPFTFGGDVIWLSDDLLFVPGGASHACGGPCCRCGDLNHRANRRVRG
jgi:hypothetical protein